MLERAEELKRRVRETPLNERLEGCRRRIGAMCSEGRPPRMCIPVQYDDDDFYISTTLDDAKQTVERLERDNRTYINERHENMKTIESLQQQVAQLREENAQAKGYLERLFVANAPQCQPLDNLLGVCTQVDNLIQWLKGNFSKAIKHSAEFWKQRDALRTAHTTLRGLVEKLPVVGLPIEHSRPGDFIVLKDGEGWIAHTYDYWAKFATEDEAKAYAALLKYRAALPREGGAQEVKTETPKPVTSCNRHSDCDMADQYARAKGALSADHCHDDCCSECFGN